MHFYKKVIYQAVLTSLAVMESSVLLADEAGESLDSIVVLGTARKDQTVLTSAAPIDVITSQSLQKTGAARLDQALQQLSPSFNFPQGGYVNNGVKSATLRGLAPDQVLVLVNGKRRHASAGVNTSGFGRGAQPVDLSTIPISAIDHVEILRDGASAQYGSDAIAGVINIVLKEAKEGGSISAQTGVFKAGNQSLNGNLNGWYGFELPGDGFLTLSFDLYRERHPESGVDDPRQWYFSGDAREATADKSNVKWGYLPDRNSYNILANGEVGLSDRVRTYSTLSFSHSVNWAAENFITPRDNGNVRQLYPDGFQPKGRFEKEDTTAVVGARYSDEALGNFDLSASYGINHQWLSVSPSVNATLGTASPTSFDVSTRVNRLFNYALDYQKDVAVAGWAKPLSISSGISYRDENFYTRAGDYGSWAAVDGAVILDGPNAGQTPSPGARGNTGLSPQDVVNYSRHVSGIYLGAEAQITKQFQLGAVGRYEHYSDFGGTSTGKISSRYEVTPSFAVRSSFSTGYRAPALGQSGYALTGIQAGTGLTFVETRGLPVDSAAARALGATDLKPEKSTDFSLGLVWQPVRNASVTLDAYVINIKDRITLSDNLGGSFVTNILTAAGYPQVTVANFFTNGVDTRTSGVDLTSAYQLDLESHGRLTLNAAFSSARTEVIDIAANPAPLASSGLVLFGRQAIGYIEDAAPKNKWVLGLRHQLANWDVTLNTIRYGTFIDRDASNAAYDQKYSAQWVTNLDVGYQLSDAWRVNLGANNLFDTYPDKQIPQRRTLGQTKYSPLSPAGYDGRFVYARLTFDF